MPNEPESPRFVGGLWCREVLDRLGDYVDGALPQHERAAVEAHVAGCDWCEQFGGTYARMVAAIRRPAAAVPEAVADRLAARLREV